ncbi:MAG: PLP-dependent aminotransferase family protein [Oceanidesulfovibrio sp.]
MTESKQSFWAASRLASVRPSFIREILKVTEDPSVISFAGGLPNPDLFPLDALNDAASKVFRDEGPQALQYSTTEGFFPLREWIANRYAGRGVEVSPQDILITTGSQQGLDLIGKCFIDTGETVLLERPGYLGAIQAFSLMSPRFCTTPLDKDGPALEPMAQTLAQDKPTVFYAVPNFQNPSGVSWSAEKRAAAAGLLQESETLFVEDDPYGELRFAGTAHPPVSARLEPNRRILLGSFSKIAAPGLRVGWLVAGPMLRRHLVTAKQAADLHTSTLNQRILARFLEDSDLDAHIAKIREAYGRHAAVMIQAMEKLFPEDVDFTRPEGGMFLWATLPEGCSAMELFERAIQAKVAFVPGAPFHVDGSGDRSMRLNFSNASETMIEEGVRRLAGCLKEYLATC